MRTKIAILSVTLLGATIDARAALFLYDGFAILNNNGAGNVYHDLDLATGNPDFVTTTFTVNFGGTLKLGGQVKTDPGGGNSSAWGADWAKLFYRIDGGTFSSMNLSAISGTPGTDWYVQWEQANTANMVNVANGLSVGTHTLDIYFQAHDNTQPWDGYLSNSGNNYRATVQVVPEPVTIAALIFGGAFVTMRLWRRARGTKVA